jgi:hypothetical protein
VVLGTGGDLTIVHDGTDSTLTNITGNLVLDNTGSGHIYLSATTGNVRLDRDSEELQLGASQDLRLYHDGTDCFLRADTGLLRLNIGANTALQFNSSRAWGVDGANYGTVGQVLTSNGSSAAPGWTTPAGGGGIGTLDAEIMADTPTAFWKLDEASGNPQDSSGNGFHLTSTTNLTYQYAPIIPSLPTTSFLRFNATTGQASYTGVLGTSPPLTGSWTYEIVVNVDTFTSNNCGLCRMGAAGETAATNFQVLPYLASTGALAIYWESGSGVDRDNITTTNLVEGKSYHLVFQKDGTNDTLTFYVNGIKVTTLAYLNANEPTGGTDAAMSTGIGATVGGATAPMTCGYAAFYNGVLLTPARIAIHARAAGLYGF